MARFLKFLLTNKLFLLTNDQLTTVSVKPYNTVTLLKLRALK